MAKRKRDIFIVREAVPNWFEVREEVNEPSEVGSVSIETHEFESAGEEVANKGQISRATSNETYLELPTRQDVTPKVQSVEATPATPSWVKLEGRGWPAKLRPVVRHSSGQPGLPRPLTG